MSGPLDHAATDRAAVDQLAVKMAAKMNAKREAGFHGWDNPDLVPPALLSHLLRHAVRKGDPVDVANYCAMIAARPDCGIILTEGATP